MVRTLTIKDRVYDDLVKLKGKSESFSDLFERLASKEKPDITEFAGFLSGVTAEKMRKTIVERRVKGRVLDSERKRRLQRLWS